MFAKIAPVKALGAVAGSLTVAPAWRHIATSLRDKQHKTTHVTLQSVEREVELLRRCGSGQQNGADGQAGEAPHAAGRTHDSPIRPGHGILECTRFRLNQRGRVHPYRRTRCDIQAGPVCPNRNTVTAQ